MPVQDNPAERASPLDGNRAPQGAGQDGQLNGTDAADAAVVTINGMEQFRPGTVEGNRVIIHAPFLPVAKRSVTRSVLWVM